MSISIIVVVVSLLLQVQKISHPTCSSEHTVVKLKAMISLREKSNSSVLVSVTQPLKSVILKKYIMFRSRFSRMAISKFTRNWVRLEPHILSVFASWRTELIKFTILSWGEPRTPMSWWKSFWKIQDWSRRVACCGLRVAGYVVRVAGL